MNVETVVLMVILLATSPILFYLSNSPQRMAWSKNPSAPIIVRLILRTTAWAMLVFVFLTVSIVTFDFISSLIS
jgi:hypothetical protein